MTLKSTEIQPLRNEVINAVALIGEGAPTAEVFWRGVLETQVDMLAESIGDRPALELAMQLVERLTLKLQAADQVHAQELHEQQYLDGATGLYRKSFFLAEYNRYDRGRCTLMLIRWGLRDRLDAGERQAAVAQIGAMIRQVIRVVDFPCRWSEFEFVVLLPRTEVDQASALARRLTSAVRTDPLQAVHITIGLAEAMFDERFDHAFGRADWAIYDAQVNNSDDVAIG